jgi:hypothetical protein
VSDRVVPLTTTGRLLGEAAAAFLAQPDLAASTRRSYQQTLGRLERELGPDRPLADLTVDQLTAALAGAWPRQTTSVKSVGSSMNCSHSSTFVRTKPGKKPAAGNLRYQPRSHR